jgi:hypothetical protein
VDPKADELGTRRRQMTGCETWLDPEMIEQVQELVQEKLTKVLQANVHEIVHVVCHTVVAT